MGSLKIKNIYVKERRFIKLYFLSIKKLSVRTKTFIWFIYLLHCVILFIVLTTNSLATNAFDSKLYESVKTLFFMSSQSSILHILVFLKNYY